MINIKFLYVRFVASKQVYRPPSARGGSTTFKLYDDEEMGIKKSADGRIDV